MVLLWIGILLLLPMQILGSNNDIIVENPFYVRARIHDSHTATVLFEIDQESDLRACQMYKFTIGRNSEDLYSMPEQNLTYWRNSLDLKHLPVGRYQVCAIICSERMQPSNRSKNYGNQTHPEPMKTCVSFQASRPHLLVLTLYILAVIFLAFSHIIYSLRKRKVQARIKMSLLELENSLQKWRESQAAPVTTDQIQTSSIFQSLINLPAVPVSRSRFSAAQFDEQEHHPILFQLASFDQSQPAL